MNSYVPLQIDIEGSLVPFQLWADDEAEVV